MISTSAGREVSALLTKVFAPESLSLLRAEYDDAEEREDFLPSPSPATAAHEDANAAAARAVRPGDLLFLRTPGPFYAGVRALLRYEYDHVVVALSDPSMCLHVSPPEVRKVSLSKLLQGSDSRMILRPRMSEREVADFTAAVTRAVGQPYALTRMYYSATRRALESSLKSGRFLPSYFESSPDEDADESRGLKRDWTCSDLVYDSLCSASPSFRQAVHELQGLDAKMYKGEGASVQDLLRIHRDTDFFEETSLAPPPVAVAASADKEASVLETAWERAKGASLSKKASFVVFLAGLVMIFGKLRVVMRFLVKTLVRTLLLALLARGAKELMSRKSRL